MYKCLEHIKILRWIKLTYCIVGWVQPWNRQLQESARTGSDIVAQCGRKKEAGGASAAETWCVTMHCSELVFFFFLVHRICPSNVLFWLHSLYCTSNLIYNVKKKAEYSWMGKNERLLMLWLTPAFFKWNCPLLVKDGDTWRQVWTAFYVFAVKQQSALADRTASCCPFFLWARFLSSVITGRLPPLS